MTSDQNSGGRARVPHFRRRVLVLASIAAGIVIALAIATIAIVSAVSGQTSPWNQNTLKGTFVALTGKTESFQDQGWRKDVFQNPLSASGYSPAACQNLDLLRIAPFAADEWFTSNDYYALGSTPPSKEDVKKKEIDPGFDPNTYGVMGRVFADPGKAAAYADKIKSLMTQCAQWSDRDNDKRAYRHSLVPISLSGSAPQVFGWSDAVFDVAHGKTDHDYYAVVVRDNLVFVFSRSFEGSPSSFISAVSGFESTIHNYS